MPDTETTTAAAATAADTTTQTETLETLQVRHRKEQRDLQSRITQKKKNASKKTRKGVNDECANLERDLAERQKKEVDALLSGGKKEEDVEEEDEQEEEEKKGKDNGVDEVTEKVKNVKFDTPTPPSSEQEPSLTQGGFDGGGGKKRNRQKERLARRAAEAEAASVAAESEAANMTDHRANEKEYIHAQFKTHGLVEQDIQPDGHCLFSAVADQLASRGYGITPKEKGGDDAEQKEPGYKITRREATSYMLAHRDDFEPFLELDDGFDAYIEKMRDTAIWGGQMELVALAKVYRVEIMVVQDGRTESIDPTGEEQKNEAEKRRIWLAYYRHGYGLGEHYNSLRKA